MRQEDRWWDGPWPWLAYLVTYGIPWLWLPPAAGQLAISAAALVLFVLVYLRSFRLSGQSLLIAVAILVAIGVALVPVGGGWSVLAVYPAMQAGRVRPRRRAILTMASSVLAFLIAGLLSRQPLVWWLPSLMMPLLIGGAVLSREAFYDRTRALLRAQEEVRRLAGLAERERMARDLHDVIGRTLTLVALKADLVGRLAERDGAAAAAEAQMIGDQARAGLAEIRAGLAEIRAALAGQAGGSLAAELALSAAALKAAGIAVELHGDPAAVSPDTGALLAMTLREAVTNVIRHAGARRCRIELVVDGHMTTLTVTDDGNAAAIAEGSGLTGMRQRLVAAGGTLAITTAYPGLRLLARLPA